MRFDRKGIHILTPRSQDQLNVGGRNSDGQNLRFMLHISCAGYPGLSTLISLNREGIEDCYSSASRHLEPSELTSVGLEVAQHQE